MDRIPLVNYMIPTDMEQYLSYYGTHFNKKLYEFAVSMMRKEDKSTGALKKITPMTIDELKVMLDKYKIEIEPSFMYDALYLSAMVKADISRMLYAMSMDMMGLCFVDSLRIVAQKELVYFGI